MSRQASWALIEHQGDFFFEVREVRHLDSLPPESPVVGTAVRCTWVDVWEWIRDGHPGTINRQLHRGYAVCAECHRSSDQLPGLAKLRSRPQEEAAAIACESCESSDAIVFCYSHAWTATPESLEQVVDGARRAADAWWARESSDDVPCEACAAAGLAWMGQDEGRGPPPKSQTLRRGEGHALGLSLYCEACAGRVLDEKCHSDPVTYFGWARDARKQDRGAPPRHWTPDQLDEHPDLRSAWDRMDSVFTERSSGAVYEPRPEGSGEKEAGCFPGSFFTGSIVGAVAWLVLDNVVENLTLRGGVTIVGLAAVMIGVLGLWVDRREARSVESAKRGRTLHL